MNMDLNAPCQHNSIPPEGAELSNMLDNLPNDRHLFPTDWLTEKERGHHNRSTRFACDMWTTAATHLTRCYVCYFFFLLLFIFSAFKNQALSAVTVRNLLLKLWISWTFRRIIQKILWFINVKSFETEPTGYLLVFAQWKTLIRMSRILNSLRTLSTIWKHWKSLYGTEGDQSDFMISSNFICPTLNISPYPHLSGVLFSSKRII
jgi:hypothetical protein